jgi:nicotinate-nucleotide pyrophosphorylase
MPDVTLGEIADLVRAKNAGPFWITLDVFLDAEHYEALARAGTITAETVGELYNIDPDTIHIFRVPGINAIKISFPRPVIQGSLHDHDMHAGQQDAPLAGLVIPTTPSAGTT